MKESNNPAVSKDKRRVEVHWVLDAMGANAAHNSDFTKKVNDVASTVYDFYKEFFGALIPGFVFVFSMMALVCYTFYVVANKHFPFQDHLGSIVASSFFWVFIICLSYVVGTVLYRKEPNRPDRIGAYLQWVDLCKRCKTRTPEAKVWDDSNGLAVQYEKDKDFAPTFGCTGHWLWYQFDIESWIKRKQQNKKMSMDYPYPHLRQYLQHRRMSHIASYVFWCADKLKKDEGCQENYKSLHAKSKHFINIIKQHIRSSGNAPLIHEITKNEGEIRLLCSIWHAMLYLMRFELLILFGVFVLKYRHYSWNWNWAKSLIPRLIGIEVNGYSQINLTFLGVMIVLIFWTWWMKHSIVRELHYMRNREVVMVLEAAYMVDKNRPDGEKLKDFFRSQPSDDDCLSCGLCDYSIAEKGKQTESRTEKQPDGEANADREQSTVA